MTREKINVACVWVGNKYSRDYVYKLYAGVARHLHMPFDFVCLTEHGTMETREHGPVRTVPVSTEGMSGWWAKMHLFNPRNRLGRFTIYLDLDTVVVGSLSPLAEI